MMSRTYLLQLFTRLLVQIILIVFETQSKMLFEKGGCISITLDRFSVDRYILETL